MIIENRLLYYVIIFVFLYFDIYSSVFGTHEKYRYEFAVTYSMMSLVQRLCLHLFFNHP